MKTATALAVLALILGVLGAAVSFSGYNESLALVTTTLTQVVPTTTTETSVSRTSRTAWILQQVFDLEGTGDFTQRYCGVYEDYIHATLNAGLMVHVSYKSERGQSVNFWLLSERQLQDWKQLRDCVLVKTFNRVTAARMDTSEYELTTNIPSSGEYYFVFLNPHGDPVTISLNVDGGVQEMVTIATSVRTISSTKVSFDTHPAGFGLLFYAGIGLVLVAAAVLAISRRIGAVSSPARVPPATAVAPAVTPSPSAPSTGKFCMNCGAPLPARATFCNECGLRQ